MRSLPFDQQVSWCDPQAFRHRLRIADVADLDGLVSDVSEDETVEDDVPGARVQELVSLEQDGDRRLPGPERADELEADLRRNRGRRRAGRRERPDEERAS